MTIKDALLATIAAEIDHQIVGRTLLQKKLYFLSVLIERDFGFVPHYFGPYSTTVSDDLGALVEAGFVGEKVEPRGGTAGPFGERRRYTYTLTAAGEEVLADRPDHIGQYAEALRKINSHSLSKDATLLPIAAKVSYIVSEKGAASAEEVRQRAAELGWKVNQADIGQVVDFLARLDLVEVRADESTT